MFLKSFKCLGASLFVAANNLGVYALVVPLMAGISGFFPALGITLFTWLFTLALGLLYAEATLTLPEGGNILTMMRIYFGKTSKIITGIVVLIFLCFASLVVATQLAFPLLREFLLQWTHISFSDFSISVLSIVFFGTVVFLGIFPSIIVNSLLMIGLFFALYLFAENGKAHINPDNLDRLSWVYLPIGIYYLFALSGIQVVVPTLSTFLKKDRKSLIFSLVFGTFLTYLFVFILEWIFIGAFRDENFWELISAKNATIEGLNFLDRIAWTKENSLLIGLFGFFSYALSYYIITVDILFDGLNLTLEKRRGWRRFVASFLLVSLVFAAAFWTTFSTFVPFDELSDVVGLICSGVPLFVVWKLRYQLKQGYFPVLFGGKGMLLFLGFALFYLFGFQVVRLFAD